MTRRCLGTLLSVLSGLLLPTLAAAQTPDPCQTPTGTADTIPAGTIYRGAWTQMVTASNPVTGFYVQVDTAPRVAYVPATSVVCADGSTGFVWTAPAAVAEGAHTWTVTAYNTTGETSTTRAFTATAPSVPVVPSASCTAVPANATQIVDTALAVWTIGPAHQLLKDGVQYHGGNVNELLWYTSQLYVAGYPDTQNWYRVLAASPWFTLVTKPVCTIAAGPPLAPTRVQVLP